MSHFYPGLIGSPISRCCATGRRAGVSPRLLDCDVLDILAEEQIDEDERLEATTSDFCPAAWIN